jgi:hypothetical protein
MNLPGYTFLHMNGHKRGFRAGLSPYEKSMKTSLLASVWGVMDKPALVIKGTFAPAENVTRLEASTLPLTKRLWFSAACGGQGCNLRGLHGSMLQTQTLPSVGLASMLRKFVAGGGHDTILRFLS